MCTWAYGTIYSWRPEMDLYQASVPAVFTAILVLYSIAASLLSESLLESLLESLPESLFEGLFESLLASLLERAFLREPRIRRSRGFHEMLLVDGKP
jgi:hypothetical protein